MEKKKQILTWRCGPCDRWVSVEVEPGSRVRCATCGTEKNPPHDFALARDTEENSLTGDRSA